MRVGRWVRVGRRGLGDGGLLVATGAVSCSGVDGGGDGGGGGGGWCGGGGGGGLGAGCALETEAAL